MEGKNIVIEWRFADAKLDRLPALAAELVHLNVELIVTGGSAPTRAAKEATLLQPFLIAPQPSSLHTSFRALFILPIDLTLATSAAVHGAGATTLHYHPGEIQQHGISESMGSGRYLMKIRPGYVQSETDRSCWT